MTPERMRQIEDIFHAACEMPPGEREEYLAKICGSDEELRREVELLLASDGEAGSLVESPSVPISLETLSSNSLMSRAKEIFNVSRLVTIIEIRENITC